jgi:hypothetical protein
MQQGVKNELAIINNFNHLLQQEYAKFLVLN